MTRTCVCSKTLGRVTCLLAAALLFSVPATAQTDLQIMVSGPWAYVVDPNPGWDPNTGVPMQKRIVLVAQVSDSHDIYVFNGANAAAYQGYAGSSLIDRPGRYYLDLQGARTFAGSPTQDDQPPALYSPPPVTAATINGVLTGAGNQRVAISLPEPDYYSTYVGQFGHGMSESKISPNHVTGRTPSNYYTTWLVLHYSVSNSGSNSSYAIINGTPDDKSTYQQTQPMLPLSIVVGVEPGVTDSAPSCDTLSSMSFTESVALWQIPIYARFPEDPLGEQEPEEYHYSNCIEAGSTSFSSAEKAFEAAHKNIQNVLAEITELKSHSDGLQDLRGLQDVVNEIQGLSFGNPPTTIKSEWSCLSQVAHGESPKACPGHVKPQKQILDPVAQFVVSATAVGGGDCHMAQFNINGAIQ
jgi:hypothetical protein